jgi:hypothetical protein
MYSYENIFIFIFCMVSQSSLFIKKITHLWAIFLLGDLDSPSLRSGTGALRTEASVGFSRALRIQVSPNKKVRLKLALLF